MKVLVTGSCGFLMSNFIIYMLQQTDWDLISMDKITRRGSTQNVPQVKRHKLYVGDICDAHLVSRIFEIEKPEIIIHGAAETDRNIDDSIVYSQNNVMGTHNLLSLAQRYGVYKFINFSSAEIYGNSAIPVTEGGKITPRSLRAASKASADLIGQMYVENGTVPVITIRLDTCFGPRQNFNNFIPSCIAKIEHNHSVVISEDPVLRHWIYVKDAYNALKTIIEKGKAGDIYNLGGIKQYSSFDIVQCIIASMKKPNGLIATAKHSSIDNVHGLDCTKLLALGWLPQYNIEDAVAHTTGWYMANPWSMKWGR